MLLKRLLGFCASLVTIIGIGTLPADAWPRQLPGFDGYRFFESDRNQSRSFTMVPDPIDPSNTSKVYKFSIRPERCKGAECEQQSVRSSVQQGPDAGQPDEAWYGWDIYFPPDFPQPGAQKTGLQQFNEWKDQHQCGLISLAVSPNHGGRELLWRVQKPTGLPAGQYGYDCTSVFQESLGNITDLMGKWHRFEVFIKWSGAEDGQFVIYLDGKKKVVYSGPTCFTCGHMNYYSFGNYLCCTDSSKTIQPSTVYYRYLSRAARREDLTWH